MDAPPQGYYKLNTDVACFANGMIGMGGVVRDVGDVLVATCHKMRGSFGADISKVVAARHSLGIALDASFNRLILEYDNLKLIQHLKDERSDNTPFSLIVKDILHITHTCQHINFVHVELIMTRHTLARIMRKCVCG
uniref:RNase H type-1 domain-containing protein n=1 Tax=Chenopodium quinoa TaxID=63459 RepID=A0A803MSY3_CHEQI